MPTPMGMTELILPQEKPLVKDAIETALVKAGVIEEKQETIQSALNAAGLTIEACAFNIANLANTAKEATKLRANERAIQLHGIPLAPITDVDTKPTFVFNIDTGVANLNQLFAPERG